ncbi:hypothetical protein RX799_24840 [Klebsiella oxytoca]|uniref:hypothetical protein n=1 Tax=Klebsiella oxytoca TaxID=571 RepID=UPI00384FED43
MNKFSSEQVFLVITGILAAACLFYLMVNHCQAYRELRMPVHPVNIRTECAKDDGNDDICLTPAMRTYKKL